MHALVSFKGACCKCTRTVVDLEPLHHRLNDMHNVDEIPVTPCLVQDPSQRTHRHFRILFQRRWDRDYLYSTVGMSSLCSTVGGKRCSSSRAYQVATLGWSIGFHGRPMLYQPFSAWQV